MEGAHLDLGGALLADELDEPLAHLVRSLIREGDGTNGPRGEIAVCDEVCNAHGEDLGLAAPGSCEDLERNLGWMLDSWDRRLRLSGRERLDVE